MSYRFVYDINYQLTMQAVLTDARAGTPIANAIGDLIKEYVDTEIEKIIDTIIPYKIESTLGNLAGYLLLKTVNFGSSAEVFDLVLRPAYQQFKSGIDVEVRNFIGGGDWRFEVL